MTTEYSKNLAAGTQPTQCNDPALQVSIHPKRPSADVPTGNWITGRATFYAIDDRLEDIRVACGEPKGQFGALQQGSCGYTNADLSLPFPREVYAALADTNEDYPGSCGRCYEVRGSLGFWESHEVLI